MFVAVNLLTDNMLEGLNEGVLKSWLESVLPGFFSFLWALILAFIVYFIGVKITKFICKLARKSMDFHQVEDGLAGFTVSIVKWICYIVLIIVILGLFGITTTSIAAAVAALGVTAGLSLQGALSNFAGGCLILLMHPFRAGDYIIEDTSKNEGYVDGISIIYTTLITREGKKVVIPNGTLANASLTNVTANGKQMINETVGISYSADIKKAKDIISSIIAETKTCLKDEPVTIFVAELGDSAVKIGFRFWTTPEDYWQTKWDTFEEIKTRFDEAGVEICFNQLDVHIDNK